MHNVGTTHLQSLTAFEKFEFELLSPQNWLDFPLVGINLVTVIHMSTYSDYQEVGAGGRSVG